MANIQQFYINGTWVDPINPVQFDLVDPSTEEVYGTLPLGGVEDAEAAIAAAKTAFPKWMASSKAERIELIESIIDVLNKRNDELGDAISQEMGAPIDMARGSQAPCGPWHSGGFLTALKEFEFEHIFREDAPGDYLIHEPIGVCALITPWNWPVNQIALKVIPAIAAGCTSILKPSEFSPLSAAVWSEVMHEAGVPAGVYNMLHGNGTGVGTTLTTHKDVDMVSFTGSTRAGQIISKVAADTVKRVSLELGGKGANIIFADADAGAVARGVAHCFGNSGQSCNAPTRMLVERSRYDAAVAEAKAAAEATAVASAHEAGGHIGPVVNKAQFNKIQELIGKGIDEGCTLVAGGLGRPDGLEKGYFVKPTVFADCPADCTVMVEEIFGPVLSIMPFDTEEEAIALANDTVYGLTNYVQTTDKTRAMRMARALRSGMVDMNGNGRHAGGPFGGMKQSGSGREGGAWGLHEFLEVKAIGGWPEA